MRITLDEVASKAGVSRGTASLVLNDRTNARIGVETRQRIRRVAQELGYEPNLFARSLSTRRTNTIGLIVPSLRNAFFADVMDAAEVSAHKAGYQALLDAAPFGENPGDTVVHKLRGWQFDGVLIYSIRGVSAEDILGPQASRVPVVYLGNAPSPQYDCVVFDLADGARQLVEHLVERGYRRIAYVSPFDANLARLYEPRYIAYVDVCERAGLPVRFVRTFPEEETREAGLRTAERLALEPDDVRPDAIVCHNDTVAIGAYCGAGRAGLRVPDDLAIAGFDGIEEGQYLVRSLTSVVTPIAPFCAAGIELLVNRIRDAGPREARTVTLPVSLRIGDTT
ncbi:MAG: LacI family DNA-binding transcriptional regulator [Capsulimonadaceae bacterium]|nr:LacI family DNA-binding transcriptional regulator [Capsulimonadaceae bacterium]